MYIAVPKASLDITPLAPFLPTTFPPVVSILEPCLAVWSSVSRVSYELPWYILFCNKFEVWLPLTLLEI